MINNIGGKIQTAGILTIFVGIVASIIGGVATIIAWYGYDLYVKIGICIVFGGSAFFTVSGLIINGFGTIVKTYTSK